VLAGAAAALPSPAVFGVVRIRSICTYMLNTCSVQIGFHTAQLTGTPHRHCSPMQDPAKLLGQVALTSSSALLVAAFLNGRQTGM
jgi:hypothetical protein